MTYKAITAEIDQQSATPLLLLELVDNLQSLILRHHEEFITLRLQSNRSRIPNPSAFEEWPNPPLS